MRDRIKRNGIESLASHEILEYLLFFSIPMADVNPLAHRLINRMGSLEKVLSADPKELKAVDGVGEKTAAWLNALYRVLQDYEHSEPAKGWPFESTAQLIERAAADFQQPCRQEMALVSLNGEGHVRVVSVRPWDTFDTDGFRWVMETLLTTQVFRCILIWKRLGRKRFLTEPELNAIRRLNHRIDGLEVRLDNLIIIYGNDYIDFKKAGLIRQYRLDSSALPCDSELKAWEPDK